MKGLRITAALVGALCAAALLGSCAKKAAASTRPPRSVRAEAAVVADFSIDEEYAARIEPSREINVTPKVPGRVESIGFEVGARVAAGQALLRLEASDYDAQYRQAKAALGSAKASLARTSDSGQEQQVLQAQAAADEAGVAYDDAKSLYEKTKRLFDSGAVSKQQLDDAEARFKSAGIQRDAAASGLSIVKGKAGTQTSDIGAGQVEGAQAQADLAKSQLDAAVIRSPIAGRVSYRGVETGELVGPSTLAFVVIDEGTVLAEAGLSERAVGRVRRGMKLEVAVPALGAAAGDSGGGPSFTSIVDSVSPSADPRTMLYDVKVRLANPDGALKGGMLAKLRVPTAMRRGALLVPEKALFAENGGDYVFVAVPTAAGDAGKATASKRRLALGDSDGARAVVLSGIAPGDLVVTEGQDFIEDGDAILVTR
jgi:HlyD family secretion protein